jgi:ankyrin repeat protein
MSIHHRILESFNITLREAACFGDIEVVRILLGSIDGIDPSTSRNLAIREASRQGYSTIVRLLLETGKVDPTDNNNWAIKWASANGHIEVVKLLLDYGADPTHDNDWAITNAGTEEIKDLLEAWKYRPDGKEYCRCREGCI